MKFKRKRIFKITAEIRFFDKYLFLITTTLMILGLAFVCSASSALSNAYTIFIKQTIWTILAFFLMVYVSLLDLEKIRTKIPLIMIITIILLIITLFMPPTQNARRWIPLGLFKVQTSEIAKISVIFYISHFIDKNYSKLSNIKILIKPIIIISIILLLIAIEPDIGTPFIIFMTSVAAFFIAGIKLSYIITPILISIPIIIMEIKRHKYRIDRIKAFLNPWQDPEGKSFQIVQSLAAIGSGWWFGKGPGNSIMKLKYLPESHTDFIFPIIAEETGFIGVSLIILLFTFFFIRALIISKNSSSVFLSILAFSSAFLITFQAIFNIAMSAGMLPTKGIPLPFFSYGGSSIVTTAIMVGFILNVSMRRKKI
ncbi:MAG: putative lipid II flippase FtsW [Elusimicrobiales bacterium]|nr:putative lipid II flippase FtsW [Elusimicrobiales bacterium]